MLVILGGPTGDALCLVAWSRSTVVGTGHSSIHSGPQSVSHERPIFAPERALLTFQRLTVLLFSQISTIS